MLDLAWAPGVFFLCLLGVSSALASLKICEISTLMKQLVVLLLDFS